MDMYTCIYISNVYIYEYHVRSLLIKYFFHNYDTFQGIIISEIYRTHKYESGFNYMRKFIV